MSLRWGHIKDVSSIYEWQEQAFLWRFAAEKLAQRLGDIGYSQAEYENEKECRAEYENQKAGL